MLVPLGMYLQTRGEPLRGITFIDASSLAVCHNRRFPPHRVFRGVAQRSKTKLGWFYGSKLHLGINDTGGLVSFMISSDKLHDCKPVEQLTQVFTDLLFGDKAYLSQPLFETLFARGLNLITAVRWNMKHWMAI